MTDVLLILTLLLVAAIVAVLVAYLVGIIYQLWSGLRSLKTVVSALDSVEQDTRPLPGHMNDINGGLVELRQTLSAIDTDLLAVIKVARGD